jgi:glycosyltransferase involved in cell wall biosynthesis
VHILFCNFEYPPLGGGGGVVNAMLAEELARRHRVTVLTSRGPGLPSESVESGVRIVRVPVFFRRKLSVANMPSMFAYLPSGILRGRGLLRRQAYDVINTHFVVPSGPVGNTLSRHSGVPNVLSVHGGDLYDPSKWTSPHRHAFLRAWIRRLLRRADAVVGQSRNTLDNVKRYYAPEIDGIRIPLGICRPPAGGAAARGDYELGDDDILLVTVGRLVPRKGLPQLVRLLETLADPRVRLVIVGSGPEEPMLREEAARRGVAEQIVFAGFVSEEEKFRILRMCDAFVSTSQHEGFGLVFLEAMACGLPVVCYDFGGQTDFLEDGRTGFLAPLNDEPGFADRCRRLIGDPALAREQGEQNRKRVEDLFIESCAARYEEVFDRVVADRSP